MIVIESGFTGTAAPLTTPRIGAWALSGTVTASSEVAGFEAGLAATEATWTGWKPSALPATWEVDFGTSETVSYCGIAAHNLGTAGATVYFETWDGAAWNVVASITPADDGPIFFLCDPQSVEKARIRITGSTVPFIAVVMFGDVVEFPQRAAYVGRRDIQQLGIAEYRVNVSDGGHVLGRYIARRGQSFSLTVDNLSEAWKASDLDPLILHLESHAVFVADRPADFLESVAYGQTTGPVVPERTIPNSAASVAVTMEFVGYVA